jgi:hypothetical protein
MLTCLNRCKICEHQAIDCQVSPWTAYTPCSVSCGVGSASRSRTVTEPAKYGGRCTTALLSIARCAPGDCPVDCVLSEWSNYGTCSTTCGGGLQTRTRTVVVARRHGGAWCGAKSQTKACNTNRCPLCSSGTWYLGLTGLSCDAVCSMQGSKTCDQSQLTAVTTVEDLQYVASQVVDSNCSAFSTGAGYASQPFKSFGACYTTSWNVSPTCQATDANSQRFCCCVSA